MNLVPEIHIAMPDHRQLLISCSLIFLLAACGYNPATPTPAPAVNIYAEIETAVAQTLAARATTLARPTLTFTPTPTSTPTLVFTSTATSPSPTSTIVYRPTTTYHCEDADFIRDVTIPDGTILLSGQLFIKTWKFKNTGNCSWEADYSMRYVQGNRMGGYYTEIGDLVSINERISISVELLAPVEAGTYTGYWQLADDYGNPFGDIVHVRIVVVKPTATPTASATPTFTLTPTGTVTTTVTTTSTFTPTTTGTVTTTPTPTCTATNTATATASATATMSPTATSTDLPTSTNTLEPTPTATSTATVEDPQVASATATSTSTATEMPD